jgi:hypothetical protein
MVNVGSYVPVCPAFYIALHEGGPTTMMVGAPHQAMCLGNQGFSFSVRDHLPWE